MTTLLLVLSPDSVDGDTVPPRLRDALEATGAVLLGIAPCHTLVQQVAALAPQQVLIHLQGVPDPALHEALQAWEGMPPCALALASAELDAAAHAQLVALGVHAWAPRQALAGSSLAALLAQAQARHHREAALHAQLAALRVRMEERQWVERAKGLLMSARGIAEDQAFGLLRGASMHANLRLGEVARSVVEASQWAEAINRAGQLRMLSQRLVRVAAQVAAGVEATRARRLRSEAAERMQRNLDHLAALASDPAASQALASVQQAWAALSQLLAERLSVQALRDIDARADALLQAAEALTEALEASGARRALRIVNLCGRQRMRAQRLAKAALLAVLCGPQPGQDGLAPQLAEFETALLELELAPLSSPDIRAALAAAREEWMRLVAGVHASATPEGRAALVRSSDALVEAFDGLTARYEHSLQVIMG